MADQKMSITITDEQVSRACRDLDSMERGGREAATEGMRFELRAELLGARRVLLDLGIGVDFGPDGALLLFKTIH